VVRKWKRVMAVGCSHGSRANKQALAAVLRFRDSYKPAHVIHLGDAYDLSALRAGALANPSAADAADDYMDDIDQGRKFLNDLRPTVFTLGNHDERAKMYLTHHNAVVRGFAEAVWQRMIEPIKRHTKVFIEHHGVLPNCWYELGGYKWGHGTLYSENFLRDSAETWGNCVVAHAHRAGVAYGRRSDGPCALSPGTLADVPAMEYAHRRRGTLAWSHGIVFGEVTGDKAQLYVHQWPQHEKVWTLPSF
jgi:hypothetical protein